MSYKMGVQTSLTEIAANQSNLSMMEIDRIREIIESEKKEKAVVGFEENKEIPEVRVSEVVWMTPEFVQKHNCYDVAGKITDLANFMNEKFFQFDLLEMESVQLTKYDSRNQGFYKPHIDSAPLQGGYLRKLSMIIQLSDPSEFEGGDFVYHDLNSNQTLSMQETNPEFLQKGMVIAFPSFIPHGVTPVTKGARYSLVAWCNGPRFK